MGADDAASRTPQVAEPNGQGAADPAGPEVPAANEETHAQRSGSRRFPEMTTDTARPEGGGRAAAGDAPATYRQWPVIAVGAGALAGLLVILVQFRIGAIIVGLSLLGAAALRWSLTSVGMLAVRSRFTDLVTYAALGTAITLLAMMAQPDPWVTIPFLDDIVHFSVR